MCQEERKVAQEHGGRGEGVDDSDGSDVGSAWRGGRVVVMVMVV